LKTPFWLPGIKIRDIATTPTVEDPQTPEDL